jgi:hypothetical protein
MRYYVDNYTVRNLEAYLLWLLGYVMLCRS